MPTMTASRDQEPRTITATSEDDLAAVFADRPSVESVETGREDGTGNWAFDYHAEQYAGHTYARVHLAEDADRNVAIEATEDAGHVVEGVGHDSITVREGRDPLPENLTGLDAWDALIPGDRFEVGMGVAHEAIDVIRDDEEPEKVREVHAIPVYRIEKDAYDAEDTEPKRFVDATLNRMRRIQPNASPANESRNARITEMHGEFIAPDP